MSGFIYRIPFFRLLLALTGGIAVGAALTVPFVILLFFMLLAFGCMLCSFWIRKPVAQFRFRWLFGCGALVFVFVLGCGLFQYQQRQTQFSLDGAKRMYAVAIKEPPIEKAKSTLYKVEIEKGYVNGKVAVVDRQALLYVAKNTAKDRFDVGDQLLVYASFSSPPAYGNPEEFDFAHYLQLHGISATGYVASGAFWKTGHDDSFSLKAYSSRIRLHLLDIYHKYHIEGDEFAVVAALMLGYNEALTRELMDSYSVTGAMHVLSVSGLHVAVICAVFYFLLGFMDKKRSLFVAKHLIAIVLLWGFAFLTGLAPAVVRAALMFSLIAFGYVVSRKPQIFNTIFFSAFVMLVYNPAYLFDVGFQLSYLAVLSIVYFEPKFRKLIDVKNRPLRWLWELVCVSLAAQLGTAALGVFYFHKFSNFFWLSNIVIVPLSSFVMYAAMALLALSPVPTVAQWVAFSLKWLLILMNGAVRWIEHLPLAAYNMWIDHWQLFFWSVAILLAACWFASRRYAFLITAFVSLSVCLIMDVVRFYESYHQKEVVVWADGKNTHVQFTDGFDSRIVSSDTVRMAQLSAAYNLRNGIAGKHFEKVSAVSFAGKRFLITNDTLFRRKFTNQQPLMVDFLIIGNKTRTTMSHMLAFVAPRRVIIDQSISPWYSKQIRAECDSLQIACTDTKIEGAVRLRFN